MKRTKIVAGNWKMNNTLEEGVKLAGQIATAKGQTEARVVLCTPFIHLTAVGTQIIGAQNLFLGAQNCHQEEKGAYTGEVSASMLQSVGVEYVIIGHSERREYFKETNAQLAQKLDIVLSKGMTPIFCCGEPLAVRQKEKHVTYVARQLRESLFHLDAATISKIVIAYEPVWAIGTGLTASPEQAQEMHASIRKTLSRKYGKKVASGLSILYGGSCNASNARQLFALPDVDGGLIGGASLKAEDFVTIIHSF